MRTRKSANKERLSRNLSLWMKGAYFCWRHTSKTNPSWEIWKLRYLYMDSYQLLEAGCSWDLFSSVSSGQSLSRVQLFATPWTAAHQASLSITNSKTCSNSCPSSWWCHPTILSFVVPFSSCLQSFPASGSFLVSQFFTSGGQSIGASASASVLPMNIQDWIPLGLTGWISLQSKWLSRVFSNTTVQKHQFFCAQLSL